MGKEMPEPVRLFQNLRDYPRHQIVEMLKNGDIEPTRKALQAKGRSVQQSRDDLRDFRNSGGGKVRARPNKQPILETAPPPEPKQRVEAGPPQEPIKPPKPKKDFLKAGYATIAGLLSIGLGATGAFLNWRYASSFGVGIDAKLFGIIGAIAGGIALLGPTLALEMYWRKCWLQMLAIIALWLLCLVMDLLASSGFASRNISDSLQGRDAVVERRENLQAELATVKIARWKIAGDDDPAVLEQQIQSERGRIPGDARKSSKDCTDVTTSGQVCERLIWLRRAQKLAQHRIELDARIAQLGEAIGALPTIASRDPGADLVNKLTFGLIDQEKTEGSRVSGIAILTCIGPGILLAAARTLIRI